MNIYPALMERDLERFEQIFTFKKKSLEGFISLMMERAELEENYAKSIEKLSTNLSVFADKGPLADILNSLKSYHAMRSEQSMTLATSLKDEVVTVLRAMLRKEAEETKRVLNNGRKNDYEMKAILERIETTRKRYVNVNTDIEETHRTKALLNNMENNDGGLEERKKAVFERLGRLVNFQNDCDNELRKNIEDYNGFKKTFTEQYNSVVEYFKKFDINRLNSFRDSTMKYFVFEISYLRNIQYDVNKVIQNVETAEFSKEVEESILYRQKNEPSPMDFDKFKEMFVDTAKLEEKNKGSILFEKTQIPENLGLSTALKSIVGLFSNPKTADGKKKEEEKKFIEKQWEAMSRGQVTTEENELRLFKLLSQHQNRKTLIDLFSSVEINLSEVPAEQYEKARDTILQTLQHFLIEAWQNKGYESLRYYLTSIQKHTKQKEGENKEKKENDNEENIYSYIDDNLSSMAIFNNEAQWKEFLARTIQNSIEISLDNEQVVHIGRMRKEIAMMRHFYTKQANMDSFITSIALENGLNLEGVERLLAENYVESENSDTSSQERTSEKQENLSDWIDKMEQKISQVEKSKKTSGLGSIFSARPISNSGSPMKRRIALEPRNELLNQSISDSVLQKSHEKVKKRIFQMNPKTMNGVHEHHHDKLNESEMSTNTSNISMAVENQ